MPWTTDSLSSATAPSWATRSAQSSHIFFFLVPTLTVFSSSTSLLHSRHVAIFVPWGVFLGEWEGTTNKRYQKFARWRLELVAGYNLMERRFGPRAHCDFPLVAIVDGFRHACRAVDLSVSGLVFERPRGLVDRELSQITAFELDLGAGRPIRLRGRPVWAEERLQAIRFVSMNDADRLTLAEQLDRKTILGDPMH